MGNNGRKVTKLDPVFARELRRIVRRQRDVDEAFREIILRGRSEGMSFSAMAREIDPSGENISRKVLWQWVQAWSEE